MEASETPTIRDLAFIGDRQTTAAISRTGNLCWYCPGRFDRPTLFAALLDPGAGDWRIRVDGLTGCTRQYLDESAVLRTSLHTIHGDWSITDWMALGTPHDVLCREVESASGWAEMIVSPRPEYGASPRELRVLHDDDAGSSVLIDRQWCVHASLPVTVDGSTLYYRISPGTSGWFALLPAQAERPSTDDISCWRQRTLESWRQLHEHTAYEGPYAREVKDSLRALRLLTHADTGGIIAAATFGLPEVVGGARNYDYRYVWLRDAAMIVSALTRAGSEGTEERAFLDFLCSSRQSHRDDRMPLPPFVDLDGRMPASTRPLSWTGYAGSQPVLVGNDAGQQLQLDGLANVLLAAKLIYNAHRNREHWETVSELAEYLADHWQDPDHGIWEETLEQQYTANKVISSVALRFIADHSDDPEQAGRWRAVARDIRDYVARHCLTSDGAYAAVAGGEAVDVSAALFPVWDYCPADTPEMIATMARLERDSSPDGLLYRRHLVCADAQKEGAFLAGTLWVAQYWIMRDELSRAKRIIDAALEYSNDVGLLAEEADEAAGEMLGNMPQSFVHAALIGAVVDLRAAGG